ncbi:MAG: TonB-dependent receptor plug domain-containing protein [Eudoraea sp.]|nr:TonB-dependent receptor plug domain-containing protein [Eudoraea sp.]
MINRILSFLLLLVVLSCTTYKSGTGQEKSLDAELQDRNRATVSLLDRLRRTRGIIIRRNTPYVLKSTADSPSAQSYEPLYVLDGYPIGNSFRSIRDLVQPVDVKEIEVLTGSDASFYGSRAGAGVIKITTYKN